jgi:coenzyme F420 hydrogenase subunit beta
MKRALSGAAIPDRPGGMASAQRNCQRVRTETTLVGRQLERAEAAWVVHEKLATVVEGEAGPHPLLVEDTGPVAQPVERLVAVDHKAPGHAEAQTKGRPRVRVEEEQFANAPGRVEGTADERGPEPGRGRPTTPVTGVDHPCPGDRPVQRRLGADPVELHFEDLGHGGKVSDRCAQSEYGGPMPPEKPQWAELFTEVVTSGLCTGCSACVVVCPYDVLGYNDQDGVYKPFHVDADGGPDNCTHGLKGCTLCTRACPRFRTWEPEIENHLFGRPREDEEVAGISRRTVLARATDPTVQGTGQDGGLVSALLIWAFEHDVIDAALVSGLEGDGSTWKAVPRVARSKEDVLATAGSRYTYSANPLAYAEAIEGGAERIALVGMGCQASAPPVMQARKAGKVARRFVLSIGLLCSKTFDDAIFSELFEAKYGLARADIVKMNIKGVFQVWMKDGSYHEVPLKEAHAWTREGCKSCPDFAAEHADISTGGIGAFGDWTLTLLRTEKGEELFNDMEAAGVIETRPIDDDPGAVTLLNKLSRVSRKRWPATAVPMPGRLPAPAPTA